MRVRKATTAVELDRAREAPSHGRPTIQLFTAQLDLHHVHRRKRERKESSPGFITGELSLDQRFDFTSPRA